MTVGPTLFALVVWGSVASVLATFGYVVWLLVDQRFGSPVDDL